MKKIIIIVVTLFYFATNALSQPIIYRIQKIGTDTMLMRKDAPPPEYLGEVRIDPELIAKYHHAVIDAFLQDSTTISQGSGLPHYSNHGLYRQTKLQKTLLIRDGIDIKEVTRTTSSGDLEFAWEMLLAWILTFPCTFIITRFFSKAVKTGDGLEVLVSIAITLAVAIEVILAIFLITGFWLPLLVNSGLFLAGMLCGYLYRKSRTK